MKSFNRVNVLATKGNLAVKTAGETVYTKYGVNAKEGEVLVFNPKTNKTLGVGDLATASHISVAVGVKERGKMALKHVSGSRFNLKNSKFTVTATTPSCGCPQVIDIFPSCLECGETYSINVRLDDYLVRSRFDFNEQLNYVFTERIKCTDCDDCTEEADAVAWLSAIRDKINDKSRTALEDQVLPRVGFNAEQYRPFKASLLYDNTFTYTLPLGDDDCEQCSNFAAVAGALVDGKTFQFVNTVDPSDNTQTLVEQKQALEDQLNEALDGTGGSAYITTSDLACCPFKIEINTCDSSFELHDENGAEITPDGGAATNPLTAYTKEGAYNSCSNNDTSITPTVGLRIFVDPIDWAVEGDGLIDTNEVIPNIFIRRADVEQLGYGWDKASLHVREVCKPQNIHGQGLYWLDKERKMNHTGGSGNNHRYSSRNIGRNNIPDKYSKVRNLITNSKETYCVYNWLQDFEGRAQGSNIRSVAQDNLTWLLVPQKDTTTQTSLELFGNKFNQLGYAMEFATCLGVVDDVVEGATEAAEETVDVSTNDTVDLSECEAVTYEVTGFTNAETVSISDAGSLTFTPSAAGEFTVGYQVFCDGILVGGGTVSGTASAA